VHGYQNLNIQESNFRATSTSRGRATSALTGLSMLHPSCAGRARPLARVRSGIAINEHTDKDGAVVFLLTAQYRSPPSRDWINVKNPTARCWQDIGIAPPDLDDAAASAWGRSTTSAISAAIE
jgi:hypothetical protein